MKRAFDMAVAASALILLGPVLLGIAAVILARDGAPVLFRQERVGRGGRPFLIYKFRTMRAAPELAHRQLTVGEDSRITSTGRWLRRYKLDEAPQLLNVLKGDMSLVGPRPEVPRYVALYTDEQRRVLELRPGITDVASIRFRNESELLSQYSDPDSVYINSLIPEKIRLNLDYASRANFFRDLAVLARTVGCLGR